VHGKQINLDLMIFSPYELELPSTYFVYLVLNPTIKVSIFQPNLMDNSFTVNLKGWQINRLRYFQPNSKISKYE